MNNVLGKDIIYRKKLIWRVNPKCTKAALEWYGPYFVSSPEMKPGADKAVVFFCSSNSVYIWTRYFSKGIHTRLCIMATLLLKHDLPEEHTQPYGINFVFAVYLCKGHKSPGSHEKRKNSLISLKTTFSLDNGRMYFSSIDTISEKQAIHYFKFASDIVQYSIFLQLSFRLIKRHCHAISKT